DARAEQAQGGWGVGDVLLRAESARLVHRPSSGNVIVVVEGREVEPLSQHEDVGHDVAAAPGDAEGDVVAAGAGIRVGSGDAVEVPGEDEAPGGGGGGGGASSALGPRPPAALLDGPHGGEEAAAMLEQLAQGDAELFSVLQVARDRDLLADLSGHRCPEGRNEQ